MNVLAEKDGKVFAQTGIDGPDAFVSPFEGELFPCLIWDHDGCVDAAGRSAIARKLLESGCRYAVCGGQNCEAWHDAIDIEYVEMDLERFDAPEDIPFVMTTWHDAESPDDVAFFFVQNTNFDAHDFRRYLVLHIGTGPTRDELDAAVRQHALDE